MLLFVWSKATESKPVKLETSWKVILLPYGEYFLLAYAWIVWMIARS